jgi:hypothetical protein
LETAAISASIIDQIEGSFDTTPVCREDSGLGSSRKAEEDKAGTDDPSDLIGAIRREFSLKFWGWEIMRWCARDPWKLVEIVIRCIIWDSLYSEISLRCQGSGLQLTPESPATVVVDLSG